MTTYSLIVSKIDKNVSSIPRLDNKHTSGCSSSDDLKKQYDAMKTKYNAVEVSESTMGHTRSHGMFKKAEGTCKHGKEVIIESNATESMGCFLKV